MLNPRYCEQKRDKTIGKISNFEFCAGFPDRDLSGLLDAGAACHAHVGDPLICAISGSATVLG